MVRRAFGRDASGYPDVTHLVPRRMMQVFFPPTAKPEAHKINSAVGFRADFCAAAFPIVRTGTSPVCFGRGNGSSNRASRAFGRWRSIAAAVPACRAWRPSWTLDLRFQISD
jgi:hypothetical protein